MTAELERCRAEYGDPRLDSVDDDGPGEDGEWAEGHERRASRRSYVIAVYLVDRCYGGPEEGGWWYDAGELVRVVAVKRTSAPAHRYANRMQRSIDRTMNRGRRPLSSVLSEGVFQVHVFPDTAPQSFPLRRPHYE